MYTYEQLDRERRTNPISFAKERMCTPVHSADSFFSREALLKIINNNLKNNFENKNNINNINNKNIKNNIDIDNIDNNCTIVAGFDIGKKRHPSHLAVFSTDNGTSYKQILSKWFDKTDYYKQITWINDYIMDFTDAIFYDATRGELDGFAEKGELEGNWQPVILTPKNRKSIATQLETAVNLPQMELINDQRQINQLLQVNSDLTAIETAEGHGDSFWSVGLAVYGMNKILRKPKIKFDCYLA